MRPACCLPECGVNFQSSKSTDHSANLQECSQCTELPISSARRPCLSHPGHRAQRCKNDWPDSVMQSWRPRHGGHDGGRGGDLSKDDAAAPAPALTPHPHTHTPSRWTPPPGPVGNSVEQVAGTRTATAPSSSSTAVVIQERKTMIDRQLRIANNSCSCSSSSRNGGGAGAALNSEASNHHSQDNNSNSARGKERTTVPL